MFLYFLYLLFSPVLFIITVFLSFFNIKIRKNLLNCIKTLSIFPSVKFNSDKQILLFHAASSGEFEQLKPILKSINRDQYYIVQSFTSPTVFEQEQNNIWVAHCWGQKDKNRNFAKFGCARGAGMV